MDDNIWRRTWNRSIATVTKIGFMDGASDGQKAMFQSSFDLGYKEGLNFGFELEQKKTLGTQKQVHSIVQDLIDTRKINCQFCLNVSSVQEQNIGNMHNLQQGKNIKLLGRTL